MNPSQQVTNEVSIEGGVVVGDDGSREAARAVAYALQEAARRDTTLHVVRAWSLQTAIRPPDTPLTYMPSLTEFEQATRTYEQTRLRELLGDDPGVPVELHVVHAPPGKAMVQASHGAEVVVVGSRGLGGFTSLLLGSVAEQVVRHAGCPVVVVREQDARS